MVIRKKGLYVGSGFQQKSFNEIFIFFTIKINTSDWLFRLPFFQNQIIIIETVHQIERNQFSFTLGIDGQNFIIAFEISEQASSSVGIQPPYRIIEPDFPWRKCRYAFFLHIYLFHSIFCYKIPFGIPSFDGKIGKINIYFIFSHSCIRL